MGEMFKSATGGFALSDRLFGSDSSVGTVLVLGLLLLDLIGGPKALLAAGRHVAGTSPTAGRILQNWIVRGAAVCVIAFVILVVFSAVSIRAVLQPNFFIGWVDGKPLSFGRKVSSVTRFTWGSAQYCPRANVEGIVRNDSGQAITLQTQSIHVTQQGPDAEYTFNPISSGIVNDHPTTIQSGSTARISISAMMTSELCGRYTPDDLEKLRKGRLTAIGNFLTTGPDGRPTSLPFSFDDLPIAPGGG